MAQGAAQLGNKGTGPKRRRDKVEAAGESPAPDHLGTLQRRLKSRQVQLIALSGAIGTGLFVGSDQVLSLAGSLSALVAYAVTGSNLYCVMGSLGEMAAWLPVPGAVPVFAARYVDPALGFALAWNYWYRLAMGVSVEPTACAVVVDYWHPAARLPPAAIVSIGLASVVAVNCLPVRFYGEAEFIFGAVKITTIVGLIVLMLLIAYLRPGALGRFLAFVKVFTQVTFSYGGSEMVVVAAGETENPRRNIPKAVRRVFWRIAVFYVQSIFLVGLCVSSRDPNLLNAISSSASGAAQSPFAIAINTAGIATLPSVINAVILSSAWSAGNSFFYASTRILYSAALDGKTPSVLCRERFGVPYACVLATSAVSCLAYLSFSNRSADVFFWFSQISAVSILVVWASVSWTYLQFYCGLRHHGVQRDTLPYTAPLQPFLAWFSLVFCLTAALFNGFDAFFPGKFGAKTFLPPYVNILIFLSLFLGYKLAKGTRFVRLSNMDIWSGKAEIDRLEPTWRVIKPRNVLERIWFWIA
ncbi:amino acid permease [Hirsutella rhossiliensis]|uniref:Amino acid permease domain-containing protein n=1 Tax=Hirsutella rhossiliensis TaxID=111463 RepID=A0A9P8MZ08_9HYPO|nr:amino acid permease domain-containing protein [Hirsutella rhossiliensis]KAH0961707.1 amino acid permease domain-containing protein [Hirsutella rhossiliensis]